MITSVYLSNQTVQIVQGERGKGEEKIQRAFSVDIPEGSLLNGTIINEQELQSHLKEIWIKYELPKQDIELVVNGTVFGTKSISVPAVKEKKILEMLPMEFVDVERVEDAVYDYMLIEDKKKEKSQELLAVMADKKTIQSYIDLFAQIEVKLDLVSTTYCTVIKLLQHKLPADGNSYIVQLMDGNSIASMLWVDGKYTYTSRKRIFAQRGTEAFGMEVVRNVSQIQQFYASLKNDCPLQKILCCGFSDMDLVVCKDSLEQAEIDLSIGKLDYQYADQGFAVGNLMRAKRDVNFCRMIKSEKKTNKKIDVGYFIPPAIAFGICFAVSAGVMGLQAYESNKVDKLYEYVTDETNLSAQQQYLELQAENDSLQLLVDQTEQTQQMLDSYPFMNSEVADTIVSCSFSGMQVEVMEYHSAQGQVVLQATAADVNSINQYVDALQETGIFSGIDYPGYTMDDRSGVYVANISCYLLETAGR